MTLQRLRRQSVERDRSRTEPVRVGAAQPAGALMQFAGPVYRLAAGRTVAGAPSGATVQRARGAAPTALQTGAAPPQPRAARQVQRQQLPPRLRAGIEFLSGLDMSDVRVHRNSNRPSAVDALAYARGTDIYLRGGADRHLAHEAWHIAQQKQGRVRATARVGALKINTDSGLEREADAMGARAERLGRPIAGADRGVLTESGAAADVAQPKFASDPPQPDMAALLDPQYLGVAGTFYDKLWQELRDSAVVVTLAAGSLKYHTDKKTMDVPLTAVKTIRDPHTQPQVKADLVAMIAHEMSHAHDDIVKKRAITPFEHDASQHIRDVLDTELRAWAREALVAWQVGKQSNTLISGWATYTDAMLDNAMAARSGNEVVRRLWDYVKREGKFSEVSEIQPWITSNKTWLCAQINRLRDSGPIQEVIASVKGGGTP